jgi:hypothetical protein
MDIIYSQGPRKVWFAQVQRPFVFESPVPGREFVLFLYQGVEIASTDEFCLLSDAFIDQRCRYAVCAGHQCGAWDDSIDSSYVMAEIDGRKLPDVMTTWHTDWPLDETVDFLVRDTRVDDEVPEVFVVLVLGGDETLAERIRSAVVAGFEENAE